MLDKANRRALELERELESFKKKVVAAAVQAMKDEDWCREGAQDALKGLGLSLPSRTTVSFDVITKTEVILTFDDPEDESFLEDLVKVDTDGGISISGAVHDVFFNGSSLVAVDDIRLDD